MNVLGSKIRRGLTIIKILTFIGLSAMSLTAFGQVIIDNMVDDSIGRYENRFLLLSGAVFDLVINTFYLLAVIEVSWAFIKVMLDNEGLQGFLRVTITRIMFIGFFTYLLNEGADTSNAIIDSFVELSTVTTIATGVINPSNVMDAGQDIWARIYADASAISLWDIVTDDDTSLSDPVVIVFSGMVAIVVMALLTAHFTVVLIESYFAASGGLILLGLGSSRWTYQYAVAYLKYAVSVGMKLFILLIVMTLTLNEVDNYLASVTVVQISNVFALLAFLIFALIVSTLVPNSVKGMLQGVSVGQANIGVLGTGGNTAINMSGQIKKRFLAG